MSRTPFAIDDDCLLNAEEAAGIVGIPPRSIVLLAQAGRIPTRLMPDGKRRFRLVDVLRYAEERSARSQQSA